MIHLMIHPDPKVLEPVCITVISAAPALRVLCVEFSNPPVTIPKATITIIPIDIPTIARALLVLFLNGFFTTSDKNDIIIFFSHPFIVTMHNSHPNLIKITNVNIIRDHLWMD